MTLPLHDDERVVSLDLVRKLIDSQFPQFRYLPLERIQQTGSSNLIFRLGKEYAVRIPRQPGGGRTLVKEARWSGLLQETLPYEVPRFVGVGKPADEFEDNWTVLHWIEGNPPQIPAATSLAEELAALVQALRDMPKPADVGELQHYRGGPLAHCDEMTRRNLIACQAIPGLDIDLHKAEAIWDHAIHLTGRDTVPHSRWFHGDLVAENLLLDDDGHLLAMLDLGGLGIGDPAVDLHGAWEMFDSAGRESFRQMLGVDEIEWLKGRAWALAIALMTFPYYWSSLPQRVEQRLRMATAVIEDFDLRGG